MAKNHAITMSLYQEQLPEFCKIQKRYFLNHVVKILLFERKKTQKILTIIQCYKDFMKNKQSYVLS
jgi:hypothetical protein